MQRASSPALLTATAPYGQIRKGSGARAKRDKELGRDSLLSRGLVKLVEAGDGAGAEVRLEITAAGRKALAAALKDLGGDLPPVQAGPPPKKHH